MSREQLEKRKGPRIHTALPVILKNALGMTRDVSASGLFFWTSALACERGDLICLSVELSGRKGKVLLRCKGDVVRTEPSATDIGVAVRIIDSAMKFA